MKLNEPFEYKGYWWKSDDPENKVAGVITYKPRMSITLELIGSFDKGNDAVMSFFKKSEVKTIHGEVTHHMNVR